MKPPPFISHTGIAAALGEDNVDTDIIFPARFLLLTSRKGLGQHAFHDRRFTADGGEVAAFVLNRNPFRAASVLVAGENFGSGSSREQAVWALGDFGFRVVIAVSFGEIFHANCLRNGILPIAVDRATADRLLDAAGDARAFTADLRTMTLSVEGLAPIAFILPAERREALMNGWDETDLLLESHGPAIASFEAAQRRTQPWLHQGNPPR